MPVPFTLEELEQMPKFKAASFEEQRKLREGYFTEFVASDPMFGQFSREEQIGLAERFINRAPVFKNENSTELQSTVKLIQDYKAGDPQALQKLSGNPYVDAFAKSTLLGTAGVFAVDKLNNLLDPDNSNDQLDYTIGKEGQKLQELVAHEVPEFQRSIAQAQVFGTVMGFAEAVAIGLISGGTNTVVRGFGVPIANKLGAFTNALKGGALERTLAPMVTQTANAFGAALGFSIAEVSKTLMSQQDPLNLSKVASNFGVNVATDYGMYMLFGAAGKLMKFSKRTMLDPRITEAAREKIVSGIIAGDTTVIMKELDYWAPDIAKKIKASKQPVEVMKAFNLDKPEGVFTVLAAARNIDLDILDVEELGKGFVGKRYLFKDPVTGKALSSPLSASMATDFLAKEADPSKVRFLPEGHLRLGKTSSLKFDLKNYSHDVDASAVWNLRKISDDPKMTMLQLQAISKAEGFNFTFKVVPAKDVFGLVDDSSGAQWGLARQVPKEGGGFRLDVPALSADASGVDSPALKAWKDSRKAQFVAGAPAPILIPDRFLSAQQRDLFLQTYDEAMVDLLSKTKNFKDATEFADYLKPYGLSTIYPTPNHRAMLPKNYVVMREGIDNQFVRADLNATRDIVHTAYGTIDTNGSIIRNTDILTVDALDGTLKFRISTREALDPNAKWSSLMDATGETRLFNSIDEVRQVALKKIIDEGRMSDGQLLEMLAGTTGYQIIRKGDDFAEAAGGKATEYMVALMTGATNRQGISTRHIIASGRTVKELFQSSPWLYDDLLSAYRNATKVSVHYVKSNPYIDIKGRVFSGSDNDILKFFETHKNRPILQEVIKGPTVKSTNLEAQMVTRELPGIGDELERPRFAIVQKKDVYEVSSVDSSIPWAKQIKDAEGFLLTPGVGSRTLYFQTADEVKARILANRTTLDHIFTEAALKNKQAFVTANGAIGVVDEAGNLTTLSSRKDFSRFFERDIFVGVNGQYDNEVEKASNEILGAIEDWRDSSKAVVDFSPEAFARDTAVKRPLKAEFETTRKVPVELTTTGEITVNGKRVKIDLYKQHDFGWEINFRKGTAETKDILRVLKAQGTTPVIEGDLIRVRVGGRDKASGIADALEDLGVIQKGQPVSDTYMRFTDNVSGRFISPDGTELPYGNVKDLKYLYSNFYAGGGALSSETKKTFALNQRLKDLGNKLLLGPQAYLAPVDEFVETTKRMGVPGAEAFGKFRTTTALMEKLAKIDTNLWHGKLEVITKNLNSLDARNLSKLIHVAPEDLDEVARRLEIPLTPQHKQMLGEVLDFFDDFMRTMGVSANGRTDMSRTADVTYAINQLKAMYQGGNIPYAAFEDLANKFKNSEAMPAFIKVMSDSLRPDELFFALDSNATDIKTFMQNIIDATINRKYFSLLREDAAKIFMSVATAKASGFDEYVKGFDKVLANQIDQLMGKKDISEELINGLTEKFTGDFSKRLHKIPILEDSGIADALDVSKPFEKISNLMTVTTQGGKIFNVWRNGTQPLLGAAIIGVPEVLNAWNYVLDNPQYIQKLISRASISEGFIERIVDTKLIGRMKAAWLKGVGNSEVINRATMIKAAEIKIERYVPRLKAGLETEQSFIKAIGADSLYAGEQKAVMDFIKAEQPDVAADILGTIWQDITQFKYGPENMGLAFKGAFGKAYGKFLNQNVSTMALFLRLVRSKINPVAGIAAGLRLVAVMEAMRATFQTLGVQYDGFGFLSQTDVSGGPGFDIIVDTLRATQGGESGQRSAAAAQRTAVNTMIPGLPQYNMADRVNKYLSAGRYRDAFWALTGAPSRSEDQRLFLESFE